MIDLSKKPISRVDKSTRTCCKCGKAVKAGYMVDGGTWYYCSDECLLVDFTAAEWIKETEENEGSFWTDWENE